MNTDGRMQLSELVLRLADGSITSPEKTELESRLLAEPEAVEFSATLLMEIHLIRSECRPFLTQDGSDCDFSGSFDRDLWECMARYEMEAPGVKREVRRSAPPKTSVQRDAVDNTVRKINKVSLFTAAASLAALLLLLAYPRFVPAPPSQLAGRITRMHDAQWADTSGTLREGSDLYLGVMKLTRGLAEITLESGARVIVEAPAEFELESASQMFLKSGRLAARVKNTSDLLFVVRTPNAAVVDLGTEFGVRFANGRTEAHVFDGEVEIRNSSNPLRFGKGLSLKKGQGGQVDSTGELTALQGGDKQFVRSEEMGAKIMAAKGSAYHQWLAFSYALRRDPHLIAYYTFEKNTDVPDSVQNLSGMTAGALNAAFPDADESRRPAWTTGRWPEKTALRFSRADQQYMAVPGDAAISLNGPLTLTAWIKCPGASDGGHILSNRTSGGGACNYQLGYKTSFVPDTRDSLHIARKKETDDWGNHIFTGPVEPSANWMMIAVTHDNHHVSFYRNGAMIESRPWRHQQPAILAQLWIGTDGTTNDAFYFNGVLDEIAIFSRALSAAEIQRMYEAGKP